MVSGGLGGGMGERANNFLILPLLPSTRQDFWDETPAGEAANEDANTKPGDNGLSVNATNAAISGG